MIDELFAERVVDLVEARDLPCNTGWRSHAGSQSALGRVHDDKRVHLVRGDRALFDVRGRSAEQRIAIDLLADPSIGIVSLGGNAGTGKSVARARRRARGRARAAHATSGSSCSARSSPSAARSSATCPGTETRRWRRGPRRSSTRSSRSSGPR